MGLRSQLAPLLGARRPALSGAPTRTFETVLRQHEDERHQEIIERLPSPERYPSSLPPGWRAEDVLGHSDGFQSLAEAAKAMNRSEAEIAEMVRSGLLECNGRRVRPAVVSVLAVSDER